MTIGLAYYPAVASVTQSIIIEIVGVDPNCEFTALNPPLDWPLTHQNVAYLAQNYVYTMSFITDSYAEGIPDTYRCGPREVVVTDNATGNTANFVTLS